MSNRPPEVPNWVGFTVIALFAGFILAMFLGASSYGPFRVAGLAIIIAYAIGAIFWNYWTSIAPASDPRNVTHIDSGKTVIASADFCAESSLSRGKVDLGGESWDAICESKTAPREGDRLIVERRDGSKLIVRNSARNAS